MSEQAADQKDMEKRMDMALREGLQSLPVPEVSEAFDARVLAALNRPAPWWRALRAPLRPLLSGAACSLCLMLLVIHWSSRLPLTARLQTRASGSRPAAVELNLDRPDLTAASFTRLSAVRPPWLLLPSRSEEPPKPRDRNRSEGENRRGTA